MGKVKYVDIILQCVVVCKNLNAFELKPKTRTLIDEVKDSRMARPTLG